jgi:hypothetical protein
MAAAPIAALARDRTMGVTAASNFSPVEPPFSKWRSRTARPIGTALAEQPVTDTRLEGAKMVPLQKTLKRALNIDGRDYVLAISPDGLKLVPKGKRKGIELKWEELVNGEAALAVALRASIGRSAPQTPPANE